MKRYMIGRAETNDIVLQEPSVSREHAELTKIGRGVFLLRDLGSTYGTSARPNSDWHLVTGENVTYTTPIRIGEFETTVAQLLREVDPLAVYMENPTPPWVASGSRLTDDERAQHPETIHVGWGPGGEPTPIFGPKQDAAAWKPAWSGKLSIVLASTICAVAIAAIVTATSAF